MTKPGRGQKVLLAIKNMGGESEAAWRALLDNLVARGLKTPELVIVDGSSGLDKALAALWSDVPVQRPPKFFLIPAITKAWGARCSGRAFFWAKQKAD